LRVVGGTDSLGGDAGVGQVRAVEAISVHPLYDRAAIDNDIALLRLVEPFDFATAKVAPLAVVGQGREIDAGTDATVVGWGRLNVSRTLF